MTWLTPIDVTYNYYGTCWESDTYTRGKVRARIINGRMTHKFIILSSREFSAKRDEGATLMRPRRAPKTHAPGRLIPGSWRCSSSRGARRLSNLSKSPGDARLPLASSTLWTYLCLSRWREERYGWKIMCVRGDINDRPRAPGKRGASRLISALSAGGGVWIYRT